MAWLPNVVGPVFAEDRAPVIAEERSFGGYAFFAIYRTGDGRHLTLGGVEPKFVRTLLTDLGRPDLIDAACGPPGQGQAPVKAFLSETFADESLDYWMRWFDRAGRLLRPGAGPARGLAPSAGRRARDAPAGRRPGTVTSARRSAIAMSRADRTCPCRTWTGTARRSRAEAAQAARFASEGPSDGTPLVHPDGPQGVPIGRRIHPDHRLAERGDERSRERREREVRADLHPTPRCPARPPPRSERPFPLGGTRAMAKGSAQRSATRRANRDAGFGHEVGQHPVHHRGG